MSNKILRNDTYYELLKLIDEQNNKKQNKMATRKKTVALAKPKTYTLSEAQFKALKDASEKAMEIRRILEDLEGEDNKSRVMFKVGMASSLANQCEDGLDDVIGEFESADDMWNFDEDDN